MNFFRNFIKGKLSTKISYFVMGFSCFAKKQFVRGSIYLLAETAFVCFMVFLGGRLLADFITLGVTPRGLDEVTGYAVKGDNALLMLLFGVFALAVIIFFLCVYVSSVKYAYKLESIARPPKFRDDIHSLIDGKFHFTMLTFPVAAIIIFTVIPLVFMILIAFTDYSLVINPEGTPNNFFNWYGFENFRLLFSASSNISTTFFGVLSWTLIWAFFATFLNYFLGIGLALLINTHGLKGKAFFRLCFVITIAIPQFISLLIMRTFLADVGVFNSILLDLGIIKNAIPFLTDGLVAKITIIVVNLWVGIPFTMLIASGILMNIPEELYEAASIDGCPPLKMFFKITMPYMLFITAPYLITQFIGNINNFNIIYLLTSGGPRNSNYFIAGETDLLITWLYKLTGDKQNYGIASVIGIMVFALSAIFSLIFYRNTASYKKEGDFS